MVESSPQGNGGILSSLFLIDGHLCPNTFPDSFRTVFNSFWHWAKVHVPRMLPRRPSPPFLSSPPPSSSLVLVLSLQCRVSLFLSQPLNHLQAVVVFPSQRSQAKSGRSGRWCREWSMPHQDNTGNAPFHLGTRTQWGVVSPVARKQRGSNYSSPRKYCPGGRQPDNTISSQGRQKLII